MGILSIALFFAYTFCLGFTVSSFVKNSENFLERNLMRIGLGLSILPFLVLALNIIKIPADWRIILALSLAYPLYHLFRHYKEISFNILNIKITKADVSILLMLFIFAANLYVYLSGAFAYPYLEDDDSWAHTFGAKYVSMRGNVFAEETELVRYINPYPPSYDILMGVLHQTNDSMYWTLKFFNALVISLSTIFFYFFVKELSGDRNKALFASFALFSIPAFMSHFIWSISLSVPLYFVAFYALERVKHDKKWWITSSLAMVAPLTSSPTHSVYFLLLLAFYIAAKGILAKRILTYEAAAGMGGIFLSLVFWWVPVVMKHGFFGTLKGLGIAVGKGAGALSVGGTGDKAYTFADFFYAQKQNMINNPIGIGLVISLLAGIALAYALFKYRHILLEKKKIIMASFFVLGCSMLFLLFSTYTKSLWVEGKPEPIPFNVFISNQFFLIASLSFSLLAFVALAVANYSSEDFKDRHLIIVLGWFMFLFYAVNAAPFRFKLSPFRAWMLLAIPVCILAAEGALRILEISKKSAGKSGMYLVFGMLLLGIYFTSTQQKIAVNTATWPPGAFWTSGEEIGAYLWMKDNLPKNSKVFTFWNNGPVIGMDMYSCHWCKDVRAYMKNGFNESANENYNWLRNEEYRYIIIDGQTAREFGGNETGAKLQGLAQLGAKPVFQNQGAVILKV